MFFSRTRSPKIPNAGNRRIANPRRSAVGWRCPSPLPWWCWWWWLLIRSQQPGTCLYFTRQYRARYLRWMDGWLPCVRRIITYLGTSADFFCREISSGIHGTYTHSYKYTVYGIRYVRYVCMNERTLKYVRPDRRSIDRSVRSFPPKNL